MCVVPGAHQTVRPRYTQVRFFSTFLPLLPPCPCQCLAHKHLCPCSPHPCCNLFRRHAAAVQCLRGGGVQRAGHTYPRRACFAGPGDRGAVHRQGVESVGAGCVGRCRGCKVWEYCKDGRKLGTAAAPTCTPLPSHPPLCHVMSRECSLPAWVPLT